MVNRSHLQLLSKPGEPAGSAGFKLTGVAKEGDGMCRVWLRHTGTWSRYLDPRFRSPAWDVRCYTRTDSAFSLVEEFSPASLDELSERYEFPVPGDALAGLKPNGDPVHDTVLTWAKRAIGATDVPSTAEAEAPAPPAEPAPTEAPAPPAEPAPTEAAAAEAPAAEAGGDVHDAWDEIAEMAERATGVFSATEAEDT